MIFLDTSAIYALADRADRNHRRATRLFDEILQTDRRLLTHSYVLVESMALLHNRLGGAAALALASDTAAFVIEWVDSRLHAQAVEQLAHRRGSALSFVDQVSFLVMRARQVEEAFAFDRDFRLEGFRLLDS
jgi:predicted nucleic acid-binding protein